MLVNLAVATVLVSCGWECIRVSDGWERERGKVVGGLSKHISCYFIGRRVCGREVLDESASHRFNAHSCPLSFHMSDSHLFSISCTKYQRRRYALTSHLSSINNHHFLIVVFISICLFTTPPNHPSRHKALISPSNPPPPTPLLDT